MDKQFITSVSPFLQYRGDDSEGFDECRPSDNEFREVWKPIAEFFDSIGMGGLESKLLECERLAHQSAANFQTSHEQTPARPWELSAIPLVLSEADSRELDAGLQQRVRVLEAVLEDLLGEQRLLKERVIPAELLSANRNYSRIYHELPKSSGKRLHLTATDLARNHDGKWWVTGDRTRAPSGLGFALENRIIVSRVLPKLIRGTNVQRLARFFADMQEHLLSVATRHQENPHVAILSPGPRSYRYFEDAYLARYLGYTLVHGRDLAVRRGQLNLKTLGGLAPIDVIWRKISDSKCDPLELDGDSNEGVTGLLRIVRDGSVVVANDIGSIVMQMPAMLPFLPAAARFLFGEDLKLPNIATYWCGAAKEKRYVLDHLDDLVIRPAFVVSGSPPTNPSSLSSAAREELIEAINANPHQFVAQERPNRSTAPVWNNDKLDPWFVALRCFQLQTSSGVQVMPGGLARVSPNSDSLDWSPTTGRYGMDCWMVGKPSDDQNLTLLPRADQPISLVRGGDYLPSRVAENLFWFGRYFERAESIARLLRTTLNRLSDEDERIQMPDMNRLLAALAAVGQIDPGFAIEDFEGSLPNPEIFLPSSAFDQEQARGLMSSLHQMLRNGSAIRDRISLDAYRILSRIEDDLQLDRRRNREGVVATIDWINGLIPNMFAFAGLVSESMVRSHGWRFLELGRLIERAWQTAELLSATLVNPVPNEQSLLEAVLDTRDSLMTYRVRYLLRMQPAPVIDLLTTDDTNPRSLCHQLILIDHLIGQLPDNDSRVGLGQDEKLAKSLMNKVQVADPIQLALVKSGERKELHILLSELIDRLPQLSNALSARYLTHTAAKQSLTGVSRPSRDAKE